MRLEHVNLVVPEIEPSLNFLKVAFPNWSVRGGGTGDWYGKPRKWVHFGDDNAYITLNDNGEGANRDLKGQSVGLAHLGFEVRDVSGLVERLKDKGFEPHILSDDSPYRTRVYYIDPAGYEYEFVGYHTDVYAERNAYED